MSLPKKDRNVRSQNSNDELKFAKPSSASFAASVAAALRLSYGGHGAAVKRVAQLTGANERAVKNWFEARNAPNGFHLVILARHSDDVLRLFLQMAGRSDCLVQLEFAKMRTVLVRALAVLDGERA